MTATTQPTFNTATQVSGLDDTSIINNLVTARSSVLSSLQFEQQGYTAQVSAVASIAGQMAALKTAAQNLASNGTLGVTASSGLDGLTATTTAQAQAGSYTVQVDTLATAAKARSAAFSSTTAAVTAGTLTLGIDGQSVDVTIPNGTLADAAAAINAQAPNVGATVLWDGTQAYLAVNSRETGYTTSPSLTFSGTAASQFGFATVTPATNATMDVDGLTFTRQSNNFDDVLPRRDVQPDGARRGAAAHARQRHRRDADEPADLRRRVQRHQHRGERTAEHRCLDRPRRHARRRPDDAQPAGVDAIADLERRRHRRGAHASLTWGSKTAEDGSLSIDSTVLSTALATDPSAVNTIFADQTAGIGTLAGSLVDSYTDPVNGILTVRSQGLQSSLSDLATDITDQQNQIDDYRTQLTAEYSAMESLVSGFKSVGTYLTALTADKTTSS